MKQRHAIGFTPRISGREWPRPACIAIAIVAVVGERALAIPSPDLVVNLFASAAQLLGLVSILLGSWLFRGRRRTGTGEGRAGTWRKAFYGASALFAVTAIGWLFFYLDARDQRERRLHVNLERSSKEDGKTVGDVSLKELSFSEQKERDDGIQTEDLASLLAADRFAQIYDVRETEEYEVGRIAGVAHVRYPDLMKAPEKYLEKDRDVLLLCFNGNRSSEMCAELGEQGYSVAFMIGGYEKWIAEERPLEMAGGASRSALRELPDYPNRDVLLDTDDVMELLSTRDVLIVDVRYPGEFEGLGHLAGAVNLPARKLTSLELEQALRALPKKPVLIPCYDRRSSFFASIVGLKLSRMGFEFLGRYTTPEGFSVPGKDKPHVATWKERQEEKTLLGFVTTPLRAGLAWLAEWSGSLVAAIALCVLLLRLLVLPLAVRAERDRLVQAHLKPRLAALAEHCKGDPRAISRKTLELLRAEGVRPVLGFVATVAQLILFTLFFGVVGAVSKGSSEPWLWVPAVGEADPTWGLPTIVGGLIAALVLLTAPEIRQRRVLLAVAAGAGFGVLVVGIPAATNLYLALSLFFVAGQALLVRAWLTGEAGRGERKRARLASASVVALRDADVASGCGNKALRLAQLIRSGLPVPDGFVVTSRAIDRRRRDGEWSQADRREIERAFRRLGAMLVAVRSSGLKEDGADKSYAGVFESVLDVHRGNLFEALDEVAESLRSSRVEAYSGDRAEAGAILVQRMIPAEYAGVLFTEHPGASGACAVELVEGLGDRLVSGKADPLSLRLGRVSGRPLDDLVAPIDLEPLFRLGRRAEALFDGPQDIEWAWVDGQFYLVQARNITRLAQHGGSAVALREMERARLLLLAGNASSDDVVLGRNELSELLPCPTPYSLSCMEALWAHEGSVDLACRELGVPYDVDPDSPPLVVSAFGATFVNRREESRRLAKGPGSVAAFRLSRCADELERAWRDEFLPGFLREARMREALDLARLSFMELVELHDEAERRIRTHSYLAAERINIAADFYFKAAVRALRKRGLDPARYLAHLPETIVHQAMQQLAAVGRGTAELSAFLRLFAHRSPQDYELSQARYGENPKLARAMAQRASPAEPKKQMALPAIESKVLELSVERARRFQALKEEAKHHALRDFAFLRSLLVEMGERMHVGDDVFLLARSEIAYLGDARYRQVQAPALIARRSSERAALEGVGFEGDVTLGRLERIELDQLSSSGVTATRGVLKGLRVSGSGDVTGRARVLRESEEIDSFQDGEVLVARFTDPTWTPVFPRARGIVTEVGGWLSHAAIQAREYDLTAVVGVSGAMETLVSGELVTLRADGSIERQSNRRDEERVTVHAAVTLERETEELSARIADLSLHGALLTVPGHELQIGEDVGVTCEWFSGRLEGTVVRNGIPGIYGVRFRREIQDIVEALSGRGTA